MRGDDMALILKPLELQAYFDDSGERDQAVGVCVASVDAWSIFETEWQGVLDRFHVKWFHAVAFENRKLGFATERESERTPFLNALLDVLVRNITPITGGAFVCAIAGPELVEHLRNRGLKGKGKPESKKTPREIWVGRMVETLSDPYSVCLGQALKVTLELAVGGQDTVGIYISDQPNRTESIEYIRKMLHGVPRFTERLAGFDYGKNLQPKVILPLQAADFAAYYLGKKKRNPSNSRAWVADKLQPQFLTIVPDPGWLTEGWI